MKQLAVVWFALFFLVPSTYCAGQGTELDNATLQIIQMYARDVHYDRTRDLLFVTVGSAAGAQYGNSIVLVDPSTLDVVDSFFAGSEPNRIVLSADGRHGHVGVDGARGIRYFNPATKGLGPIRNLFAQGSHAVAQDLEIDPADGRYVVVSCDDVSSTATGNLYIFGPSGKVGEKHYFNGPTSIAFWNSAKLFGVNSYTSGDFYRFNFNGQGLTQEANTKFSGNIEIVDDLVFSTTGFVADPSTMSLVGSFNLENNVGSFANLPLEVSMPDQTIYFLKNNELYLFDYSTFLKVDSVQFAQVFETTYLQTLVNAGLDRMAFVTKNGELGVISNIPFTPNPSHVMRINGDSQLEDTIEFDATLREITVNGNTTPIPSYVTELIVDAQTVGANETDRLICYGFDGANDLALIKDGDFRHTSRFGIFRAFHFEHAEFIGSDADIATLFDTPEDDLFVGNESSAILTTVNGTLQASSPIVYSFGGSGGVDSATFLGGDELLGINANLKLGSVRIEGTEFVSSLNGFAINVISGGIGGLNGVVLDSPSDDTLSAKHKYSRIFDSTCDMRFKSTGPFSITMAATYGGFDRAIFYRPATSSIFKGTGVVTMTGTDSRTSARQFESVKVIDP